VWAVLLYFTEGRVKNSITQRLEKLVFPVVKILYHIKGDEK